MEFVRQEVTKLAASGVVQLVDYQPTIVSPLTVASNSAGKLRLCLDLSRSVNQFIDLPKVVLADLKVALKLTDPNDWQAVYDLSSAYHHIKMLDKHTKFLGAAFEKPDGSTQFFIFKFLPFGVSSAVHVMTKIMKPVSAYIAQKGIKHTIYLDDGRVIASSKFKAQEHYKIVREILKNAGWFIAEEKSDSLDSISQVKNYLGFSIDSEKMRVFLQPDKEQSLREIVTSLIQAEGKQVKAKFLAKVLGKMISSAPALGQMPLIFARLGYFALEQAVDLKGWSTQVQISRELTNSLKKFLDAIDFFNGYPILHSSTTISLISLLGPPDHFFTSSFAPMHTPDLPQEIFASDASNIAVCSYSIKSEDKFFFIGNLSEDQIKLSSGHRELLAVKLSLEAKLKNSGPWDTWTNVFWLTDSQNLVVFLSKGSTKLPIQNTVLEVLALSNLLRIRILPIHLRREDPRIAMADAGSRVRDSDDWSIDSWSYNQLNLQFGPFTLDLFADSSNAKTKKFFSDFLCPHSSGINAFAHSWDKETLWVCPPVSKIVQVLRKLKESNCKGVLVIPKWQTADFWPFILDLQQQKTIFQKISEIHPTIIQNQRALSPLNGKTSFSFLAIQFSTV